jgi:hypothetical protein
MNPQKSYDTVSEAIKDLTQRGYSSDLSIRADKDRLVCSQTGLELSPDEFRIDEIHRFEGMTDPADEMIVFAISSKDDKTKGIVLNAFSIYSSFRASKLVKQLTTSFRNQPVRGSST